MNERMYLIVYDDCIRLDDGMTEEQIEDYVTRLAHHCAHNAIDILRQFNNDLRYPKPFTKEHILSDEFWQSLIKLRVLVDDPTDIDDGIAILVDREFNWINRDFYAMSDYEVIVGYDTPNREGEAPRSIEKIIDFDEL